MAKPDTDDLRAWLDRLDAAHAAATPGEWKLWGMSVMADQDGTSNVETAVGVAHTAYRDEDGRPRTFDASAIIAYRNAVPRLVTAVRAVLDLVATYEADERGRPDQPHLSRSMVIRHLSDAVTGALTDEDASR